VGFPMLPWKDQLFMKKQTFTYALIFTFLILCPGLYAQQIHLHFPHFAGHQYEWKIFQGKDQITVQAGEFFLDGQVTLSMPGDYANSQILIQ
jgi:hypothetical protein